MSLWEPTVDQLPPWKRLLSRLFCHSGCGVGLLWSSWPPWVFIPAVAFVTFTVTAALSTKPLETPSESCTVFQLTLKILQCHWKNAAHQCATKEQIMRCNQQGIRWPFCCIIVYSLSCSSQHCLPPSVYQSVSPHMGLFLAGENCAAVVCVFVGVGLRWRASEKYGNW